MKGFFIFATSTLLCIYVSAQQRTLTLDSCRTLAIRNNKEILIANAEISAARHERKAAFSNYLPKLSVSGLYLHNQNKTSLLGDRQKEHLQNIGSEIQNSGDEILQDIAKIFPEFNNIISSLSDVNIATSLNRIGHSISDALTLDTRNIYIAAITMTQPIFTGGKITAYNKIAHYAEEIALSEQNLAIQNTIEATEQAYWQIISLAYKERLARSFLQLVKQLRDNVGKMKQEGLATESDLLSVNVKVNEAEIALLQVENGVTLARMLLCQICGLPIDSRPTLADELANDTTPPTTRYDIDVAYAIRHRPEIKSLTSAGKIYHQQINITRADYLPQIALTANYLMSSPNFIDGFQKKFKGMWNIGVAIKIPIWNWGEGIHKVRVARVKSRIAEYRLQDVCEKIELQVQQSKQKTEEAEKRMHLADSNIRSAEENLRSANLGFSAGVMTSENVLEAQTAWLQAHSAKIDARIDVIISQLNLKKALGILEP